MLPAYGLAERQRFARPGQGDVLEPPLVTAAALPAAAVEDQYTNEKKGSGLTLQAQTRETGVFPQGKPCFFTNPQLW